MLKFEIQISGHTDVYRAYTATVEIEADSEDAAKEKAEELVQNDEIKWNDVVEDQTFDFSVQVDKIEVNGTVESDEA